MESKLTDHQSNYENLKNEWLEKVSANFNKRVSIIIKIIK